MIEQSAVTKNIFINLLLIVYISIEYIYFVVVQDFHLKLIETQLLILFIYSVIITYLITKNWLDIYILFLGLIFLFLLVRPSMHLFDLLPMQNYNEYQWFKIRPGFHFSLYTMNKINFVLIYMLLFLNLGYLIGLRIYPVTKIRIEKIQEYSSKFLSKQIGWIFFILGLLAFLLKVYLYVKVLKQYGYFYLYSGNFTLPVFVRIFDDFFYIGYIIIMINVPPKRQAYLLSFSFVILYAASLLTGMRGEFFTILFAVIWLLSYMYSWKVKLWQVVLAISSLMVLAQMTLAIKFSSVDFDNLSIFDMINTFLYSQGVSILILGYFIEFSDHFVNIYSGFRYIVSPFVTIFYTLTGQMGSRTEMSPEAIYSVGDKLEYFTDPAGYYMGAGTGSSFIAELYGLGGDVILVSIGSFFLGFFLVYVSRKLIYRKYGFFITMVIVPIIFWIPRSSYIQPIQKYLFAWVLLYGFVFVSELLMKRNKREID